MWMNECVNAYERIDILNMLKLVGVCKLERVKEFWYSFNHMQQIKPG